MPWLKVDDRMWANRKANAASPTCKAFWVWSMDYSADQLTDGFLAQSDLTIVAAAVGITDTAPIVAELLSIGLFDRADDGRVCVHDYLKYNPSRQKVLEERAENAQRQADYQAKKKAHEAAATILKEAQGQTPNSVTNTVTNSLPNSVPYPYPYPYPYPGPEPEPNLDAIASNGAEAPTSPAKPKEPLNEAETYYLRINSMKRFSKPLAQKPIITRIVERHGLEVFKRSVDWLATKGKSDLHAIETCASKMATGPPIPIQPRASPMTSMDKKAIVSAALDKLERGESNFGY